MIVVEQKACANLEESQQKEWLETNGIGGFASGTISGIHTRRYHGLLIAAVKPPATRTLLLSKFEETVVVNEQKYELSANAYPNTIYPQGFKYLKEFRLAPFPTWVYEFANVKLTKTVFMPNGENTVVVEYNFESVDSQTELQNAQLELRPLLAFRDFHNLRNNENNFIESYSTASNAISVQPNSDFPDLHFAFVDAETQKTNFWYRNFEYAIEQMRGFEFRENLFQPFVLKFDLANNQKVSIVASTEPCSISRVETLRQTELERRQQVVEQAGFKNDFLNQLVAAADQFIVARQTGKTVIAGYPWFADWGRDTMIALPGLTLATNRPEIARSILLEFSKYISEGMLPNRFPDVGETPDYNTVDATLWYFEAIRAYLEKTGDYAFVKGELYDKLVNVIWWHLCGTRYKIRVDTDGLICAGDKHTQLTWMDAKSGDTVFTPRAGKAVEIQALWYNTLRIMQELAERFADAARAAEYRAMAEMAQISFVQNFWNKDEDCLFDCINGERDASIRPNQIFAVSLKHSMLTDEQAGKVVRKVEALLITPVGLRSLSPKDAKYAGRYAGNGFERDSVYHQGTVWAWLAGPFFTAYARVFADQPDTKEKLKNWLAPFKQHLSEAGLGQISEIFDGTAPHTPHGCFAQAWSVAEVLRAAVENKVFE